MLPHDVQYWLDCALEMNDISDLCHVSCSLFADESAVRAAHDREDYPGPLKNTRRAHEMERIAGEAALKMPMEAQRAATASSLISEVKVMRDLAEVLASWQYEDVLRGGALEHRLPAGLRPTDVSGRIHARCARRLNSASAIRRYVTRDDGDMLENCRRRLEYVLALPWPAHPAEADGLLPHFAERRRRYEEAYQSGIENILAEERRRSVSSRAVRVKRSSERERRARRRVMTRSAVIAAGVIGAAAVSSFARGEPIKLKGPNLTFEVSRGLPLSMLGMFGLDIAVRAGGEKLSDLCFYFEDTPPLDQLAAMALHVQSGDDLEILKIGNLQRVTPAGAAHPLLVGRLLSSRLDLVTSGSTTSFEQQMKVYVSDTRRLYEDQLIQLSFGRRAGDFRRFRQLVLSRGEGDNA